MLVLPALLAGCGIFGIGAPRLPAGLQECLGMEREQCVDLASQPAKRGSAPQPRGVLAPAVGPMGAAYNSPTDSNLHGRCRARVPQIQEPTTT